MFNTCQKTLGSRRSVAGMHTDESFIVFLQLSSGFSAADFWQEVVKEQRPSCLLMTEGELWLTGLFSVMDATDRVVLVSIDCLQLLSLS